MTTRPKGTNDFLPAETKQWQYVENILREMCARYGYGELRTPMFEATELFHRGVGQTTDIVTKEMYTFEDKGGRSITLRPEATASTARAFLEHKLSAEPQPVRVWYMGPMFRYERPQKGRFRQFHQFGVEAFGSNDPALDAEIITFAMEFYSRLGLTGLSVRLNSVGCPVCRAEHKKRLQEFLAPVVGEMCEDCQRRYETNPLRLFDCKNEKCQEKLVNAPTIADCLCDECRQHFDKVQRCLNAAEIPFHVDTRLVRGLDYYTKTAFEVLLDEIGAQSAICGGGRYDGLIRDIGGNDTPGVGFALGLERVFAALAAQNIELAASSRPDVYLAALGEEARRRCFALLTMLRREGVSARMDYLNRSLKAQLKDAGRENVRCCVIVGEDELARNEALLKDMDAGEQITVSWEELPWAIISKVGEKS